jgi:DNA uptake protein ComE-like DNA-binding protein
MKFARTLGALALVTSIALPLDAQVGRSVTVVDANVAADSIMLSLPGMTPALLATVKAGRPYASITGLDSVLVAGGLTAEQRTAAYRRVFVHINLNTATSAEIQMIPGAGRRMAHEFDEYRPWTSYAQFRREIGKYVDSTEVARLAQYTFIPVNLNTATDEDILSIPGMGRRMLREFKEYRPYADIERFRREIGKYVDVKEVARLERFVTIR